MANRLGDTPEFKGADTPDSTIESRAGTLPSYTKEDQRRYANRLGELQAAKTAPVEEGYGASDLGGDVLASAQAGLRVTQEALEGGLEMVSPELAEGYRSTRQSVQDSVKDITSLESFTREDTETHRSDLVKEQRKTIQEAEGFGGTLEAAVMNPAGTASHIGDSIVPMVSTGLGAGALKTAGLGAKFAAGASEGSMMGGSQAFESAKDGELTGREKLAVGATTILGGAIGAAGGKLADKFDAINPEAMFQGSISKIVDSVGAASLKSGLIEGGEELAQSTMETISANLAEGSPALKGVSKAAAMGLVTGAGMGVGSGLQFSKTGVIDPSTGADFQNKQVADSAKKLDNLERLKDTQEAKGVDTADIQERIEKTKENLVASKKKDKSSEGVETDAKTDYNDEVDSLITNQENRAKEKTEQKESVKQLADIIDTATLFEQEGFTEEQSQILATNVMESFAYSSDREVFLDNIDNIIQKETVLANTKPDYFGTYTDDKKFTEKDPEASAIEVDPTALISDPITDQQKEFDSLSGVQETIDGTFTTEDEARLAEDIFGDTTINELTEEETNDLASRSDEQIQVDISSKNPVVAAEAYDQKVTNKAVARTEAIVETTASDSSQEELIANVKGQVAKVKKIKGKNEYSTLKTNKARSDYHFNNKNGLVAQLKALNEKSEGNFDYLTKSSSAMEVLASKPRVSAKALSASIGALEADIAFINKTAAKVTTDTNPQTISSATLSTTEEVNVESVREEVPVLQEIPAETKEDVDIILVGLREYTLEQLATASSMEGLSQPERTAINKARTVFATSVAEGAFEAGETFGTVMDRAKAKRDSKKGIFKPVSKMSLKELENAVRNKDDRYDINELKQAGLAMMDAKKVPDLQTALENSQGLETKTKIAVEKATRKAIKKELPVPIKESVEDIGTVETLRELADQEDALYEDIDMPDALRGKKLRDIRNKIQMLRQADPVILPEDTTPQALETDEWSEATQVDDGDINMLSDDVDFSLVGTIGASKIKGAIGAQQDAIRMTQDGVPPLQIWKMTGWFYEPKVKDWKFEISDADMVPIVSRDRHNRITSYDTLGYEEFLRLDQVIHHRVLFNAYPELAGFKVVKDYTMKSRGSFNPMSKTIKLRNNDLSPETMDTLIHEIQHGIQTIENFSRGGSPTSFTKGEIKKYLELLVAESTDKADMLLEAKKLNMGVGGTHLATSSPLYDKAVNIAESESLDRISRSLSHYKSLLIKYSNISQDFDATDKKVSAESYSKIAYTMYKNLLGEMEARDTATRRLMNDQQRNSTIPMSSVPLPLSQQIISTPRSGVSFSVDEGLVESVPLKEAKSTFNHIKERINKERLGLTKEDGEVLDFSIELVESAKDLPKHLQPKGQSVKGAFDRKTNSVYIVSNTHASTKEVTTTIAHELIGHVGIRKVLGKSVDNLYHRMLTSDTSLLNDIISNVPHFSVYMEQWSKKNDITKQKKGSVYKGKDANGNKIEVPYDVAMRLADEYIANLAGSEVFFSSFIREKVGKSVGDRSRLAKKRSNLINSFIGKIAHQLRKVFGMTSEHLTKDDLLNIIAESTNHVFTRTAFDYSQLVSEEDMTQYDTAVQASVLAKKAAAEMGAEVALMSKVTGVMLEGGYGKLNETWLEKNANTLGRHIKKNGLTSKFFALGALNHDKHLAIIESRAAGSMEEMKGFSQEFYKISKNLNSKAMSELMVYFTTKDATVPTDLLLKDAKKDAKIKEMLPVAKEAITNMGESLVGLGLLDAETYLENKDSYLQTRYVKYLVTYKGSKAKPSFQDYLKKKDPDLSDMDKERLGLIKDPGFLVAESIGLMSRDIALNQMYNTIYQTSKDNSLKWVLGAEGMVKDVRGRSMNISTLKQNIEHQEELIKIHENAQTSKALNFSEDTFNIISKELADNQKILDDYNTLVKLDVTRMIKQFDGKDNPTQEEIDSFINSEYKQMPMSKRYGKLAGEYVRKEIYDSFFEVDQIFAEVNDMKFSGVLTKGHAFFKWAKVAANPTSHFRNAMSNAMMLDMGTNTNFIKLTNMLMGTVQGIIDRSKGDNSNRFLGYALRGGLSSTTMSSQELSHLQTQMRNSVKRAESQNKWGKVIPALNDEFHAFVDLTSKAFGLQETAFKTVALQDHIETWEKQNLEKGQTIEDLDVHRREAVVSEAIYHANKTLLDYSKVNRTIGTLRRLPLGAPFLTYMYKSFPVMVENFAKRPWKMGVYMAMPSLAALMVQGGEDWDDEEMEQFEAKLASYHNNSSAAFVLPIKGHGDKLQMVNMDYIFPPAPFFNAFLKAKNEGNFSSFTDSLYSAAKTTGSVASDTYGFLGGPVPTAIVGYFANEKTFGGQPIRTEGAPASQQALEYAQYTAEQMIPPWMTSTGIFNKLRKSLYGHKTFDLRSTQQSVTQAAIGFTGLNVSDADPVAGQSFNAFQFTKKYKDLKMAKRKAMIDSARRGDSPEDKASIMRDYKSSKAVLDKRAAEYKRSIGE